MASIPPLSKLGSIPLIIQSLLDRLNINNSPIPGAILTSLDRADALNYLEGLVHPDTSRFIYRILLAMFSPASQEYEGDRWNGEYLAIPQSYIRKSYHRDTEVEIPCLIDLGILETNGYINHPTKRRCRGFRIVWHKLVDIFIQPITITTPKVFLSLSRSKRYQELSDIARIASKNIVVGKINLLSVIRYFDNKLSANILDLSNLLNELNYVITCYLNQADYNNESGILTYKQSYHTTEIGGRVYASSGDQLISRELKTYWFDIPNTYNYDIKGCHISLINQIYPTTFASNWINNTDEFREKLAVKVGLPLGLMKRSVLALTYGALPTAHPRCEIYQIFLAQFDGDKLLAKQSIDRFKAVTSEYRDSLKIWFKSIEDNPKEYQTNAIGLTTNITDIQSLASHYLQGKEQEAIQWLSRSYSQNRHRYEVISNQFDGLVTVGEIKASVMADFQAKFKLIIELKDIG